jgi:hypothetical protein
MSRPAFIQPIPNELAARLDPLYMAGAVSLNSRRWSLAFDAFNEAYRLMLDGQPETGRFHKGLPLHNMGLAKLLGGEPAGGLAYTLQAFLEDSISRAEESPDKPTELEMPAARNLVYVFGLPLGGVAGLSQRVRELFSQSDDQQKDRLLRDPQVAAQELEVDDLATVGATTEPEPVVACRITGQFGSIWDRRVFIGASCRGQLAEVEEIAQEVRSRGFDPVIELEFDVPEPLIHHHALMLLHECRWAVFEVTTEAGQLMELERTRDYGIRPLVVYQGTDQHGRASMMVETLLSRLGQRGEKYASIAQLRHLVGEYLERAEAELAEA